MPGAGCCCASPAAVRAIIVMTSADQRACIVLLDCRLAHSAYPPVLQNVEPGVPVADVDQPVARHEQVRALGRARDVRPRIDQLGRRRRHPRRHLARRELVGDVEDAHARVVVGGEDRRLALQAVGPVLVQVVRPEGAEPAEVAARRRRQRRNRHRVLGRAHVHDEGVERALGAALGVGLVGHDDELAARQRQRRVRAAGVGRRPVEVRQQLRPRRIAQVVNREARRRARRRSRSCRPRSCGGAPRACPGASVGVSPPARCMPGSHHRDTISGFVIVCRSTMHRMWSVKPSKCAAT